MLGKSRHIIVCLLRADISLTNCHMPWLIQQKQHCIPGLIHFKFILPRDWKYRSGINCQESIKTPSKWPWQ